MDQIAANRALMKEMAPVLRDFVHQFVQQSLEPLLARITALETRFAPHESLRGLEVPPARPPERGIAPGVCRAMMFEELFGGGDLGGRRFELTECSDDDDPRDD